jgi:hypothetical protein
VLCLCHVHQALSCGGPRGGRYAPPGYAQRSTPGIAGETPPKFFFGWFLLFLADFAIFSGLLKIISVLGIRVLVSTEYLKTLYILYSEW